ncbi:MAG: 23S rRNA pseudouridine(1911/1915/1917) synthase RluD [Pseudomonadales bacterium]
MIERIQQQHIVPEDFDGLRFDRIAVQLFPDYSRARLQAWIKSGALLVDGQQCKPSVALEPGMQLSLDAELEQQNEWQPEQIALQIVHEDPAIIVVNKPAGLVVHPGAGQASGTLANALLHHCNELTSVPRAGVVHRLDKDTSGLLVIAKTLSAHQQLVQQLQQRTVKREYVAIVHGIPPLEGSVDAALGRHPVQRKKMAVQKFGGKPAITRFRVLERFAAVSSVRLKLETGRTHQIRVHMASIGHALIGDPLYGARLRGGAAVEAKLRAALTSFPRQALHAQRLGLQHPLNGELCHWEADLPADLADLFSTLRAQESND